MSKTISWLHISDLHICSPKHGWDADDILASLKRDLLLMQDKYQLEPDFIFFTGDSAFGELGSASGLSIASQFEEAGILFEEVRTLFSAKIPLENMFIVPGNHDVNRREIPESSFAWLDDLPNRGGDFALRRVTKMIQEKDKDWMVYMDRLTAYSSFLKTYGYMHLLQDPQRLVFSTTRNVGETVVGIVGLNSSWSCGRDNEKGKLWLGGHWQIQSARPTVKSASIRICLTHHPLNWLTEYEDSSLAPEVERNFHFLLHGHEHQNWVSVSNSNHVRIASAACYGSSEAESGYNFVRFNHEEGSCDIWLRKYDSLGGGWVPRLIHNRTDGEGKISLEQLSSLTSTKRVPSERQSTNRRITLSESESRGIFGRESDIQRLSDAISHRPIIAVYGMSGIGKTELIREVLHLSEHKGRSYLRFRLYSGMTIEDFYRQMAPILGSREEQPVLSRVYGQLNFSVLETLVAPPCLIHLDMAQTMFGNGRLHSSEILDLLEAIADNMPNVRIVLESRERLPDTLLPEETFSMIKVRGITRESMVRFFTQPLKSNTDVGWVMTDVESEEVYKQIGGTRKNEYAHPLAMVLLASVATGTSRSPIEVVKKYEHLLESNLERELFNELYSNILTDSQRHALRICALYRDGIPDSHVERINHYIRDSNAFDPLVNRCLLTTDENQEWYFLHSIIESLTHNRIHSASEEYLADHEMIAECWMEKVRQNKRVSVPNIRAASEAAYHFVKAERYDSLVELADRTLWGNVVPHLWSVSSSLFQSGQFKDQRYVLELLVAVDPLDSKAHRYLGDAIERSDAIGSPEALKHYRTAFSLDPDFPNNLGCIARNLLASNRSNELVELIEGLNESDFETLMDDYNINALLKALLRLNDKQRASAIRTRLITNQVKILDLYIDEATYLIEIGKPSEALIVLDDAARFGIVSDKLSLIRDKIRRAAM